MTAKLEKGGATFVGIKLLLCENPLPPLDEAIVAAEEELIASRGHGNGAFVVVSAVKV